MGSHFVDWPEKVPEKYASTGITTKMVPVLLLTPKMVSPKSYKSPGTQGSELVSTLGDKNASGQFSGSFEVPYPHGLPDLRTEKARHNSQAARPTGSSGANRLQDLAPSEDTSQRRMHLDLKVDPKPDTRNPPRGETQWTFWGAHVNLPDSSGEPKCRVALGDVGVSLLEDQQEWLGFPCGFPLKANQ